MRAGHPNSQVAAVERPPGLGGKAVKRTTNRLMRVFLAVLMVSSLMLAWVSAALS